MKTKHVLCALAILFVCSTVIAQKPGMGGGMGGMGGGMGGMGGGMFSGGGGYDKSGPDRIHRQMWLMPLGALSSSHDQLGIERQDFATVSRSIWTFGRPQRGPWPKEQSWQICQSKVDEGLSFTPRQKAMHRAIVFQQLVSGGMVSHAMRYVGSKGSKKQETKWQKQAEALRTRVEARKVADVLSLRIRVVADEVGKAKLKELVGKKYSFKGSIVDEHSDSFGSFAGDMVCLQPFRLLRRKDIQKELSLKPEQIKSIQKLERVWLTRTGMRLGMGFEDDLPDYEMTSGGELYDNLDDLADLVKHDKDILDDARSHLNEGQRKRFDELLLRSYIQANQLPRVEKLIDVNLRLKDKSSGAYRVGRAKQAAEQLRGLQMYYPIISKQLTTEQKRKYLGFGFVPHGFLSDKRPEQLKFIAKYAGRLVPYAGESGSDSSE